MEILIQNSDDQRCAGAPIKDTTSAAANSAVNTTSNRLSPIRATETQRECLRERVQKGRILIESQPPIHQTPAEDKSSSESKQEFTQTIGSTIVCVIEKHKKIVTPHQRTLSLKEKFSLRQKRFKTHLNLFKDRSTGDRSCWARAEKDTTKDMRRSAFRHCIPTRLKFKPPFNATKKKAVSRLRVDVHASKHRKSTERGIMSHAAMPKNIGTRRR